MYEYSTGMVCDGLNSEGTNCNQVAKFVICFLLALNSLKKHTNEAFSKVLEFKSKRRSSVKDKDPVSSKSGRVRE